MIQDYIQIVVAAMLRRKMMDPGKTVQKNEDQVVGRESTALKFTPDASLTFNNAAQK